MPKLVNMVGQRFGRLVVVAYAGRVSATCRSSLWRCLCDCGGEKVTVRQSLMNGRTRSCGCYASEKATALGKTMATHGMSKTRIYGVWQGMRQRCNDPKDPSYGNYGGRGIAVCDRWSSFENFLADMGARPAGGTLERKDVNGPYSPDNCCWATVKEQANNRRTNRVLTLDGESMTIAQWAQRLGLPESRLYARLYRGWSAERVLLTPLNPKPDPRKVRRPFQPSPNYTGIPGVNFHTDSGKYTARATLNGVRTYLGLFATIAEAQAARECAFDSFGNPLEGNE
jgi:hypothetical protein